MTEFDITYHIEVSEETMDALLWDTLPGTDYWRDGEFFDVEENDDGNLVRFKIKVLDDLTEDGDPTPLIFTIDGDVWVRGMLAARAAGVGFTDGEPSNDPEEWDFDACDHDVIIQYALFGERRYAFGVRRHRRVRDARRHHAVRAL